MKRDNASSKDLDKVEAKYKKASALIFISQLFDSVDLIIGLRLELIHINACF